MNCESIPRYFCVTIAVLLLVPGVSRGQQSPEQTPTGPAPQASSGSGTPPGAGSALRRLNSPPKSIVIYPDRVTPEQLEVQLVPPCDPVISGMVAAQKFYPWLKMRNTHGYWRFAKLQEAKLAEGRDTFAQKDWVISLAKQASEELRAENKPPIAPGVPENTPLSQLMLKYPFVFDPTTMEYLGFFSATTGRSGMWHSHNSPQSVEEAAASYNRILTASAVNRQKDEAAQKLRDRNLQREMKQMEERNSSYEELRKKDERLAKQMQRKANQNNGVIY